MNSNMGWIQVLVFLICALGRGQAREGMWIPGMLGAAFDDMQALGLKLSEEDLYSVNQSSLKDAIALFGGGCTAEMVSGKGLLFTNHHCGLSYIQSHSSVQNDYITQGFWAMNQGAELRCTGLKVSFILRLDDVTARMLAGTEGKSPEEAELIRAANKRTIEEEWRKTYGADVAVRAFNYGNQFIAVSSVTYRDVRLVGAPPSGIGKFGGDTDNWVWPRHTGDFCVFRVYAGKDNSPADYSAENKPYAPRHFFPINLDGVKEGDFSMVYGFPGRTDHLLPSSAIDYTLNKSNPMRIAMRDASLAVLEQYVRAEDQVRIQYTSKQSGIANAWKKWIGQQMGLERFDALGKKVERELQMAEFLKSKDRWPETEVIAQLSELYIKYSDIALSRDGFVEYYYYGPELFAFASKFSALTANFAKWNKGGVLSEKVNELKSSADAFYRNFDLRVEKAVFTSLTPLYKSHIRADLGPSCFDSYLPKKGGEDWDKVADVIYDKSIFRSRSSLVDFLDKLSEKTIGRLAKDPVYAMGLALVEAHDDRILPQYRVFMQVQEDLMSHFVRLYREVFSDEPYWNDANSTLRISYGRVEGSKPRDGMAYLWNTTSDGVLEKRDPKNPDFDVPPRLLELFRKREFGKYATNGTLHIAYTASNHTTGGNSGSPALNAYGELVGINFDRSWESTMSDLYYSEEICRNIMVDARYVLWVIDVYAGAGYLLDEMKIVRNSDRKRSRISD